MQTFYWGSLHWSKVLTTANKNNQKALLRLRILTSEVRSLLSQSSSLFFFQMLYFPRLKKQKLFSMEHFKHLGIKGNLL